MQQRQLGPFSVSAIGLGCMNLSHAYGAPVSAAQGERVLFAARFDAGCRCRCIAEIRSNEHGSGESAPPADWHGHASPQRVGQAPSPKFPPPPRAECPPPRSGKQDLSFELAFFPSGGSPYP